MGFCYGERTVDVGQTMGLKAPLVWVTPSTSINNYELKAQDRGTFINSRQGLHSKEWERGCLTVILSLSETRHECSQNWANLNKILRDSEAKQSLTRMGGGNTILG